MSASSASVRRSPAMAGYARRYGRTPCSGWTKTCRRLTKAKDADVYALVYVGSFDESPNALCRRRRFEASARKMTDTNPFQSNYAWGQGELIDYKNRQWRATARDVVLSGGLRGGQKIPDDRLSCTRSCRTGCIAYRAPSERSYYNPGAITSHGYFLLMPDIVFRPREPGLSVQDCVTAAVKKVIAMGCRRSQEDRDHGALVGRFRHHFPATHTNIFAAARGWRSHHRFGQQLRQPPLEFRHRRNGSYRNRTAAHGSAAVRGSAGLHP